MTPSEVTAPASSGKPPSSLGPSTLGSVLGDRQYQYRPLGEAEVRLVRVFPERKTMIKCEIIHASLESPPRYTAISYAWGDAGDTRKIELGGSLISVSASLHGALQAVRQKIESVLVWADALCIDQQNKDERTQQVQLMMGIYSAAETVAIWLGPEEDHSSLAVRLLQELAEQPSSKEQVSRLISSRARKKGLSGVVALFERDYWRRLWVVQEVFNARSITVYCGHSKEPWDIYRRASDTFGRHRSDLDRLYPGGKVTRRQSALSPNHFSYAQVLIYQGPASIPDLGSLGEQGDYALLEVLRACRRKLASDPRDKFFGILGVLPEEIRKDFRADYNRSVKDVYTEIVDFILKTTERLDVICDAIHFPVHVNSAHLPSFVPDWSHIPQTTSLGHKYSFTAAGKTKASCRFLDERLNRIKISAIYLDTVKTNGIAVGTLCTLADYLMAFLHWRAQLLAAIEDLPDDAQQRQQAHEAFARALSLGQVPAAWARPGEWLAACYHVFAALLRDRLPHLPLDKALAAYAGAAAGVEPDDRRQFLQKHFGDPMMGRCFCLTQDNNHIGMGTGYMLLGDVVAVPLGCATPVLLRRDGPRGEYRFVGDVYIDGYMDGEAVDQLKKGERELKEYVLH